MQRRVLQHDDVPAAGEPRIQCSWAVSAADTMRIRWDAANNRFVFTINGSAGNESLILGYSVADVVLPKRLFNDFTARLSLPNCTAGPSRA